MATLDYDPYSYEMPWRPNYEAMRAGVWMATAACYLAACAWDHSGVFFWLGIVCLCFSLASLPAARRIHERQQRLNGFSVLFRDIKDIEKLALDDQHRGSMWLGTGFEWTNREAQYLSQLAQIDQSKLKEMIETNARQRELIDNVFSGRAFRHPIKTLHAYFDPSPVVAKNIGQPWIHGLGSENKDLWQPLEHVNGHTMIFGTTGSGKTRCFDLIISQAIMRKEAVIIIDPKGDIDMENNAREACEALGRGDAFVYFHVGRPALSTRINPLANWANPEEVASRVAALLPQTPGSEPFVAFSWQAINTITQGLILCSQTPTLVNLRSYLEGGIDNLVAKTIIAWMKKALGSDMADKVVKRLTNSGTEPMDKTLSRLITYYRTKLQDTNPSSEVEGLISMVEHDREHFSKMIASLLPVLSKLTSGALGHLLSPRGEEDVADSGMRDMAEIIANKSVLYVGLDTLTSQEVGSAVGSLMLADLTAVAGARAKYPESEQGYVNVFVDEANEVANGPFTQLLNKGRSPKFRMFVATQTFSDFAVRLGSTHEAYKVLGNLNNLIAFRSFDPETQKHICERMPETKVKELQHDQSQATGTREPILISGGLRESLKLEKTELFPPAFLGYLPNLEYIGIISGGNVIKGRIPILVRNKAGKDA